MTQPVLLKQSFLIAVLTGVQAVIPAVVAVATLYADHHSFRHASSIRSSAAVVIVAVLCLVLVQPPRDVSTQLTSARDLGRRRCHLPLVAAAGGAAGHRLRDQVAG